MSRDYIEPFLEVLNSTFIACDDNGTGFVETNRLIDFLISQQPSWLDNETIREEFHKILNGDLNVVISKENFMKSLQGWFEASLHQHEDDEKGEYNNSEGGKCSSSTSGIEERAEITSENSSNSMEEIYPRINFGEQTYTSEDLINESSLNDSRSSQADLRFVKVNQSEISTLLRKNEYLENLNDSLLGQVSILEDALTKKEGDLEDSKNQLMKANDLLKLQIQKCDETEERIHLVIEENKSIASQLLLCEKESTKLKKTVSCLEEKVETSICENREITTKLDEVTKKCMTLNDSYNCSQKILAEERKKFECKETERENAWREIIAENKILKFHLDSNSSYTENIKCQLKGALNELSEVKGVKMKHFLKSDEKFCNLLSSEKAMVFVDHSFSTNPTIPFETSLLAELKDEVESNKKECCCVCKQNVSLNTTLPDTVDAAVDADTVMTEDKATMTTDTNSGKSVSCSYHNMKNTNTEGSLTSPRSTQFLGDSDRESSVFSRITSRRSVKKWASLFGVVLFLGLLLVFVFFHIILPPSLKRSHKPVFYFPSFFDIVHVEVKDLDLFLPVT